MYMSIDQSLNQPANQSVIPSFYVAIFGSNQNIVHNPERSQGPARPCGGCANFLASAQDMREWPNVAAAVHSPRNVMSREDFNDIRQSSRRNLELTREDRHRLQKKVLHQQKKRHETEQRLSTHLSVRLGGQIESMFWICAAVSSPNIPPQTLSDVFRDFPEKRAPSYQQNISEFSPICIC